MLPTDRFELADRIAHLMFNKMLESFPVKTSINTRIIAEAAGLTIREDKSLPNGYEVENFPGGLDALRTTTRAVAFWLQNEGFIDLTDERFSFSATLTKKGLQLLGKDFLNERRTTTE